MKAGDKMSLFKRRKKIADEVENTTEQATEETTNDTEQEQPAGVVTLQQLNDFFNRQGFSSALAKNNLNAATYYACMLIRCNALAKVPFKVYERDGDGAKESDHYLNKLLKLRPNRFMTAHDFFWASEFQRLSTGNTFWVYSFRRGKIEEVYLLDSNYVEIIVDNAGILSSPNSVYYLYTDPRSSRQVIYTSDRIVHHKYFSTDGIKGNSIQKYLVDVLSQEKYAQQVVNEKYSHGLQDPIIVTFTGDLDKTRAAQIKKKFANLGGAQNAGTVIPIPTDFGVQQLETKLVNSQFLSSTVSLLDTSRTPSGSRVFSSMTWKRVHIATSSSRTEHSTATRCRTFSLLMSRRRRSSSSVPRIRKRSSFRRMQTFISELISGSLQSIQHRYHGRLLADCRGPKT